MTDPPTHVLLTCCRMQITLPHTAISQRDRIQSGDNLLLLLGCRSVGTGKFPGRMAGRVPRL